MAKKKGSKVKSKKAKAKKAISAPAEPQENNHSFHSALKDLEILTEEKKVEDELSNVKKEESNIEKKEAKILHEEKKIEEDVFRIAELEKEIKKEMQEEALRHITMKDINRGIIGAFIGVVAHFAFIYGKEIAAHISIIRAIMLFIFSFILMLILMYETGWRKIKEKRLFAVIPKRATAIYITSLAVIIAVLLLFDQFDISNPIELFKQIAVISVLASVGAGTADLIGRH